MELIERRYIHHFEQADHAAFGAIMEQYKDKIFRMASRILKGSAESDDVVQETFIRFYMNMYRYDESKSLSAWLYQIGKNVCRDMLRKRKATIPLDEQPGGEGLQRHEWVPDEHPTPEEAVLQSESREVVAEIIDSLPDKYKPLFVGQYMHGLSLEEISRSVNLPINTVKSRMNRGRSYLKRKWGTKLQLYFMLIVLFVPLIG